jgi:hypothetical protein
VYRARAKVPAREWEGLVMSCHRAHQEAALRLVVVSMDPLARDTDLHHRTIREYQIDYRTDGASGRDEKDVGVRSCSLWCGRKEKCYFEWLTGTAGQTHAEIRNPILFGKWRA